LDLEKVRAFYELCPYDVLRRIMHRVLRILHKAYDPELRCVRIEAEQVLTEAIDSGWPVKIKLEVRAMLDKTSDNEPPLSNSEDDLNKINVKVFYYLLLFKTCP
jgi:hypothetical protein